MNLLLITNDKNKHYVLIKDFNKFMHNQTKHDGRKHFCMYCLQCFSSERVLNNHKNNCIQINGTQAVNMPEKGDNILKFNNRHKQQPVPFVIYADFEAIVKKVHGCKPNKIAGMDTKLFVVTTISTVNQCRSIEVRMLFTNLWRKCWEKLNIVRTL